MTDEELADSVSVPLRGVGCFKAHRAELREYYKSFRPLAGCGLFQPI